MRTRVIARTSRQAITPRLLAAVLALLAVILAGSTGVLRTEVSGEPGALPPPGITG